MININILKERAKIHGLECLSDEFTGSTIKYLYRCSVGHEWMARYDSVDSGCGCPYCAGVKRGDLKSLKEIAKERGFECLSTEYFNCNEKYAWRCSKGHEWNASSNNIKRGTGCKKCYHDSLVGNIENVKKIALNKGYLCVSNTYFKSKTKYTYICSNGHTFNASVGNIKQGKGCPNCSKNKSKSELKIYEFVRQLFPDAISGAKNLLKNKKFELDIYVPSIRKAIEYDGYHWHKSPTALSKRKDINDANKDAQCLAADIKLLRIDERDFNTLDFKNTANPDAVFEKIKEFLKD